MSKFAISCLIALCAALSACGGGTDQAATTTSSAVSSSTTSAPTATPVVTTPAPADTPEQQFIHAMETSGVVPQLASPSAAIDLALAVCVAYGSGKTFTQIMATLAGGDMSLGQEIDLEQAATQFYCPRFYVPER
jgi:hypothetical protein